jgi:hypothetical protein
MNENFKQFSFCDYKVVAVIHPYRWQQHDACDDRLYVYFKKRCQTLKRVVPFSSYYHKAVKKHSKNISTDNLGRVVCQ